MNSQLRSDKLAISLSLVCVAHCFFVPSFVILSSGLFVTMIDNEFVHNLILFFAVPISLFALTLGYKNHGTFKYFVIESPLTSFGIKNECGSSVLILKVDKSSHSLYWALENKTEKIKKILKIASFMLVVFLNLK